MVYSISNAASERLCCPLTRCAKVQYRSYAVYLSYITVQPLVSPANLPVRRLQRGTALNVTPSRNDCSILRAYILHTETLCRRLRLRSLKNLEMPGHRSEGRSESTAINGELDLLGPNGPPSPSA